jgi:hypothetical protein
MISLVYNANEMKGIENLELILDIDPDWKPSFISFIKRANYYVDEKNFAILTLTCLWQGRIINKPWPDFSNPFFEMELIYNGVQSLSSNFSGGLQQVSGFDIINVSNDGLEITNFKIEDYEAGVIGFYCHSISITSVSDKPIFL